MTRIQSIGSGVLVLVTALAGIGGVPALAAGPHAGCGAGCQQCEPLVANLKQFGFYQTKWRRWPGFRAASHSPGRGAPAEMIPTPVMETEMPMEQLPLFPQPGDTTPALPLEIDPLEPAESSDTAPTTPDAGDVPFDPSDLPGLDGPNNLLLPPEMTPDPQTRRRPIRPNGNATTATADTSSNLPPRAQPLPWRPRPQAQSHETARRPNVLRAVATDDLAERSTPEATSPPAGSNVVPAANWTPGTSGRDNPLRASSSKDNPPRKPLGASERKNPLRSR